MTLARKVLDFWFGGGLKLSLTAAPVPIPPNSFNLWFGASSETDKLITETFSDDLKSVAADPKLQADLSETVEGAMALLIIFDQFTRNIFRNTPEAFKYDPLALRTARLIREKNWDREMNPIYRGFAYLVLLTLFIFLLLTLFIIFLLLLYFYYYIFYCHVIIIIFDIAMFLLHFKYLAF